MTLTWLLCGFYVAFTWLLCGFYVAFKWLLRCFYVVFKWVVQVLILEEDTTMPYIRTLGTQFRILQIKVRVPIMAQQNQDR